MGVFYNSVEPSWVGIPFFYWFQMAFVIASAAVTASFISRPGGPDDAAELGCPHRFHPSFRLHHLARFCRSTLATRYLNQLHEWGLGGRRFGTLITWFLLGGDIYTAYTFIAVPALAFGTGALAFFAVPYTIIIYPILFIVFPRLCM